MSSDEQNNIYFNINTQTINRSIFQFDKNRVQPILKNPSEYELGVVRFSVPSTSIPIQNWKNNKYKIGIEHLGTTVEKYVEFVPNSAKGPLYPNTIGQVWSYQEWCSIMSNCLKELHNEMVALNPAFPASTPILWKIQPGSNIMSLYCPAGYANADVKLYFNWVLLSESIFQAYLDEADKFYVNIKDRITNRTTYGGGGYIMSQEYETTTLISDYDKLVFETNAIPVNPELLGTSINETRQVITDFDIAGIPRDGLNIQYYPSGPIRHYQLISNYPLHRVDLVIQWEDTDGNLFPIFLEEESQISVKIHFRKIGSDVLLDTIKKENDNYY
jgi:hypothetical protein